MSSEGYYVYKNRDAKTGWNDGCIVFWRAGGSGYSNYLEDAGIFTNEDKAKGYPPSTDEFVWVPVSVAREAMKTRSYLWQRDLPTSLWAKADECASRERAEDARREREALEEYMERESV